MQKKRSLGQQQATDAATKSKSSLSKGKRGPPKKKHKKQKTSKAAFDRKRAELEKLRVQVAEVKKAEKKCFAEVRALASKMETEEDTNVCRFCLKIGEGTDESFVDCGECGWKGCGLCVDVYCSRATEDECEHVACTECAEGMPQVDGETFCDECMASAHNMGLLNAFY